MATSSSTSILGPENQIEIVRGTSKNFELLVCDEHGDPVDLTGSRVIATVKCDIEDINPSIMKDSNVGAAEVEILTQSGDDLGKALIKFVPSDTQTLDPGEYIFDVWVVLTSGARHIVVGPNPFIIKRGVTVLS
jgi:hypothetical protein